MPFNYCRTKRPHEALLDLYIGKNLTIVENRREPPSNGALVEYLPLLILSLTYSEGYRRRTVYGCQFAWGRHLLKNNAGTLRSTQSGWKSDCKCKSKSWLDCETNQSRSSISWTPKPLRFGAGSKDGFSDPRDPFGMGTGLLDKSYSGDNRLVASDSSY